MTDEVRRRHWVSGTHSNGPCWCPLGIDHTLDPRTGIATITVPHERMLKMPEDRAGDGEGYPEPPAEHSSVATARARFENDWAKGGGGPIEPADPPDEVNHPAHYRLKGGVEVITLTEQLGFLEGNVVKYVSRAGRKPGVSRLLDLQKAEWYLHRLIENEQKDPA